MLPFLPFPLEVLPKTGFFPIPSNLLQVGNFNFLWIKFGSKRKQGLRQSFGTKRRQTGKKCAGNKISNLSCPLITQLARLPQFDRKGNIDFNECWTFDISHLNSWGQPGRSPQTHFFKSKTQKGPLLCPRFLTEVVRKQNVTKGN